VRENAREKARRYLGEGRLVVRSVDAAQIDATCRGGGETYRLGHDAAGGWWCSCEARGTCSHLHALQLVTNRGRRRAPAERRAA
jgi:hypothetical protein